MPLSPADVLLADGTVAVVRPLSPDDGPALHSLHERVSDEALRMRFFSVARRSAHQYVEHVLASTETDALVAEAGGRLVALATAEPTGPGAREVAFLVDDAHHGQGLGTLLLEHLAAQARDQGVRKLEAEVLAENREMLTVFADAGFEVTRRSESGVVVIEIDTRMSPRLQTAADDREFRSEARSLAALLAPRSVVVVGVRRDGSGVGAAVLRSIRDGGYQGSLTVVHPDAAEVHGVAAVPSVADVPGGVDLAVIAVPAERAVQTLEEAAAARVPAVVVISSGFEELGPSGAALQRRLSEVARTGGVRLVGPNCLGLICNDPEVRLNATFNEFVPPAGGLAVASQSGGVGIVLMDLARETGLGVRSFVSLGNKADVSSNDLLAAWYDDPAVSAAALYLESFGNARKFARFARRFAERKPLLGVVGGRSAGGRRGGASHTAAAAASDVGVRALFAQSGVIACGDAEELAHTALLVTEEPLPPGNRVGVVSNAGGLGVLAADAAHDEKLDVVELSDPLRSRLADLVSGTEGTSNPIDTGAGADPERLGAIVGAICASGEVDAVVVLLVATGASDADETLRHLAEHRRRHPEVPVLVVPYGVDVPTDSGLTTYRSAAAAVGALGRVAQYAAWRSVPREAPEPGDPERIRTARQQAQTLLADAAASGWVSPQAAAELLSHASLKPIGVTVVGQDEAVAAADAAGYPVALKLAEPDVVHKTEHKLVRIGLENAAVVHDSVADFERLRNGPAPVLVQPMVTGVELALGIVRDPGLGPLVMVAAGGVATDIWRDHAFLMPPISRADATRALQSLRIHPLLQGFRGAPAADIDGLTTILCSLGRLAEQVPEIAELDLNPVMVAPDACHLVDVKLRLADPDDLSLDSPRQLRRVR